MRTRASVALAAMGLVAVFGVITAQAESAFKVTGGGQTDVGTSGPGDTIAFNAQQEEGVDENSGFTAAKGQVQYIDRDGGKIVAIYHGEVECLEAVSGTSAEDGAAVFAGEWTNKQTGVTDLFEIYVEDHGEPNQGNDQILIEAMEETPCDRDDEEDDEPTAAHARGNVQVHNFE